MKKTFARASRASPDLLKVLRETGGAYLQGVNDFGWLSAEDKLRAIASLARFMHENKGAAGKRKAMAAD